MEASAAPAPALAPTPAPAPSAAANAACTDEALEEAASAPVPTAAPYELLQLVTLSLDSVSKRTWRLVSKATCHAVYESTTGLELAHSWGSWGPSGMTALPLPLVGKCGGLRRLLCSDAPELKSIHGLPCGLEVLEINGTAITDLSPLRHCSGLRQLSVDVWGNDLATPAALHTAGGWTQLRAALQCMPRLQRLELYIPRKWGVKAMQILAPALETLTEMQYLGIQASRIGGGSAIGEEGAHALASALAPLTRLQHLVLSRLDLDAACASALAPSLGCLTGLQRLDLTFNSLGPGGVRALAPALAALKALQHLNLSQTNLGPDGLQSLAPVLAALTALQHLDVCGNDLGPDGAQFLAPALQALSNLQVLDLSYNYMEEEAAQVLAPILLTMTSLRRLEISTNRWEDCDVVAPLKDVAGLVVNIW